MQAVGAAGPVMQLAGVGLNTYSNVMASDVQAKALDAQARSVEQDTQAAGHSTAAHSQAQSWDQ